VAALLLAAAALAGCAQQRSSGYYDRPRESSITDAQYQGQGAGYRTVVQAPSQVQIGLRGDENRTHQAAAPGVPGTDDTPAPPPPSGGANARMVPQPDAKPAAPAAAPGEGAADPAIQAFLPQAQTYLGTLPCFAGAMQCEAQRVTLTLAPNGRWRARTTYLAATAQNAPVAEQGCWNATAGRPVHVMLLDATGNTRAELVSSANNVLRVRSVVGHVPNLSYNLTRQPDLDPIGELDKQPAPRCP